MPTFILQHKVLRFFMLLGECMSIGSARVLPRSAGLSEWKSRLSCSVSEVGVLVVSSGELRCRFMSAADVIGLSPQLHAQMF